MSYEVSPRSSDSSLFSPLFVFLFSLFSCFFISDADDIIVQELANPHVREERAKMEKAALEGPSSFPLLPFLLLLFHFFLPLLLITFPIARREDAKRRGASCTMFVCNKCKNNKTTYFQMQTRSSDEPMTTFVTCIVLLRSLPLSLFLFFQPALFPPTFSTSSSSTASSYLSFTPSLVSSLLLWIYSFFSSYWLPFFVHSSTHNLSLPDMRKPLEVLRQSCLYSSSSPSLPPLSLD